MSFRHCLTRRHARSRRPTRTTIDNHMLLRLRMLRSGSRRYSCEKDGISFARCEARHSARRLWISWPLGHRHRTEHGRSQAAVVKALQMRYCKTRLSAPLTMVALGTDHGYRLLTNYSHCQRSAHCTYLTSCAQEISCDEGCKFHSTISVLGTRLCCPRFAAPRKLES